MLYKEILTEINTVDVDALVRESFRGLAVMDKNTFLNRFRIDVATSPIARFCVNCAIDSSCVIIDNDILWHMGFRSSSQKRNYKRLVKKVVQLKDLTMVNHHNSSVFDDHNRQLCLMGGDVIALLTIMNGNEARCLWRLIRLSSMVLKKYDYYYARCCQVERERLQNDLTNLKYRMNAIEERLGSSSNRSHRIIIDNIQQNTSAVAMTCLDCFKHYFTICKSYYDQLKLYVLAKNVY